MLTVSEKIKKWLNAIDCLRLTESVMYFLENENERNGRSEMQVFADELSYCISCYNDNESSMHDDLEQARYILRKPKANCKQSDITCAKMVINKYKRMIYRYSQLKKAGYIGKWWK